MMSCFQTLLSTATSAPSVMVFVVISLAFLSAEKALVGAVRVEPRLTPG